MRTVLTEDFEHWIVQWVAVCEEMDRKCPMPLTAGDLAVAAAVVVLVDRVDAVQANLPGQ